MAARVSVVVLKNHEFSNLGKREPQLLCAPDELNPLNVARAEQSKTTLGPGRAFQ
jgi:hypothetical protein